MLLKILDKNQKVVFKRTNQHFKVLFFFQEEKTKITTVHLYELSTVGPIQLCSSFFAFKFLWISRHKAKALPSQLITQN